MLLKRRSIRTIKEIDLLQENIGLVFLKTEKLNIDLVRIQIAKNSLTE